MTDTQSMLVAAIKTFVAESPLNRLKDIDGSPMWEEPLVGFADGDDPLYTLYKTVVGDFHLTPRAVLGRTPAQRRRSRWRTLPSSPGFCPRLPRRASSNAAMTDGPSLRWNHTRFQGESFNDSLRRHVVGLLEEQRLSGRCAHALAAIQDARRRQRPHIHLVGAAHRLRRRAGHVQPVGWADHGQGHRPSLRQRRLQRRVRRQPADHTSTIRNTASTSRTARAASASRAARPVRSRRRATTRRSARPT